ncbi:MAG TPA: 16S rRNA (guanine(527)-N(7))-methyltransferase RsmG [Saprospiraceae bacterium]|nr:16S rRNA (guanine(527)-N(7))-methyltransferase RsmG [Saprospiraceae bacterium]HNF10338.1 16S rRNA (guanine(527)-N(7))-methyltransferase RsmG [Saprospiraceae bacterium]HNI77953.1 16S rRNA (guanine(527)-N(7))-methyltransferase RsmG [Saprospiraceae bacterium]HNL18078.1 16S rRNA (guanine(527)-N(7))-methyltransferase RsmG [Saprospiraceae bacterium]HNN66910.1 16S rRNA (guanine(527)-N(7))-methyltransferase RsmG [Saprospiraceae bacterium]
MQKTQFADMFDLYKEWNSKINVISRKDMDAFYLHHVLHSLSLARFVKFNPGTRFMDLGCGGGFPGIPLAILLPDTEWTLVDSIGKKIHVVQEISQALGLKNISAFHQRAEDHQSKFHFIVSRAVAPLGDLMRWSRHTFSHKEMNSLPNGLIAYKGGDLTAEIAEIRNSHPMERWSIQEQIPESYFENKFLIYVQK